MGKYPEIEEKMNKRIEGFAGELKTIRAGRATAAVLDKVAIDYYGTMTPVAQVGSISSPEPRMLVIQPWDVSVLKEIEKDIQTLTDKYIKEIDDITATKEKEITEV